MTANLGLVADAAEREPDELPPQRARDRTAERGLAGSRWPDETQDRALGVALELAHGEKLEDAFLDLFEIEMVFVEHRARMLDIEIVVGRNRPWQSDQPIEVGAHHGVLGRFGRDHLEPIELLVGRLARVLGHLGRLDFLLEVFNLGGSRVALAQLLLDRL